MPADNVWDSRIAQTSDLIARSARVVVFTGAGVSTESGIPDFRSPGGIWTKYDPDVFTYQRFLHDAEARKMHWKLMASDEFIGPHTEPNKAHYAVAELETMGKLDCVITQNVDGLHEKAGNSPEKVIHLHGTLEKARCLRCGRHYPMTEVREWVASGTEVPGCPECSGLLKPDAIFFGEAMPARETAEAQRRCQRCDLCIAIGSSLVVYPAALMPRYALQAGAKLVIINRDPTDLDSSATVLIHEQAGPTMSAVVKLLRSKMRRSGKVPADAATN